MKPQPVCGFFYGRVLHYIAKSKDQPDAMQSEEYYTYQLSVFLVEDDPTMRLLTEKHLQQDFNRFVGNVQYRLELHSFTTGEACLPHLHLKPDIIVLDYYLNAEDSTAASGDVIFREIIKSNPQQKVVLFSGQEDGSIVNQLVKEGLRDYIIKDEEAYPELKQLLESLIEDKYKAYRS